MLPFTNAKRKNNRHALTLHTVFIVSYDTFVKIDFFNQLNVYSVFQDATPKFLHKYVIIQFIFFFSLDIYDFD